MLKNEAVIGQKWNGLGPTPRRDLRLRWGVDGRDMLRVLIVVNNPILGEAIERLLSREDGLLVRRTSISIDDDLASAIDEFRPSVIIVEEQVPGIELTGPDIAVPNSGSLRIITVSSEQNELEIVDHYRIPVLGLADLTTQVKGADRTV